MKRVISLLILITLCVSPLLAKLPSNPSSIQPLWADYITIDWSTGQETPIHGVICTTWSINEKKGFWMTAAHCVQPEVVWTVPSDPNVQPERVETPAYREIDGKVATIVKVDYKIDLALLYADVHQPGFRFGAYPAVGDTVTVYGFPLGWTDPIATWLRVSNQFIASKWQDGVGYMVFDGAIYHGHSGSPVIDRKGKVISVVQAGIDDGNVMALGAPWDVLGNFMIGYME